MILWILDGVAASDPVALFIGLLTVIAGFALFLYYTYKALARLFGGLLAQWVAIPLGLERVAGALAREAIEWQRDPEGGAVLCGALALLHRRSHDPAIAARLGAALVELTDIGAAGVIASGLLAASRGERDGARELLQSALDLEPKRAPARARTIATEWLIADAVGIGEWARAVKLSEEPGVSLGARGRLLAGIAARFAGTHAPTDAGLWILWALSPQHRETRPIVMRAIATPRILHRRRQAPQPPPTPAPEAEEEDDALPDEPLARALTLHARWSGRDPLHLRLVPDRLGALCRAWDAACQVGAIRRQVEARAAHLGVLGKADAVCDEFGAQIAEDLAHLSEGSGVSIAAMIRAPPAEGASAEADALGPISGRAVALLRGRLLGEVEAAAETMESRTKATRALPSVDEWKEWSRLRQLYERAGHLGGLDLRRLMFPQVHRSACNYAVWLWNERKEYGIARPIFRWLLDEAEAVGDEAAIELQRRNVGVK